MFEFRNRKTLMPLITTTDSLQKYVKELERADFITVDSEFIRESTFWPQLCLIQLASWDIECLIDPLAPDLDLTDFFALMTNESVLKVFHSARQDIEIIYHLSGIIPTPLFDSQIAAMVLGFGESVSYERLVQEITGNSLDKSSRFTDWSARPLTQKQLAYALADVTHLRDIYQYLAEKLQKEDRVNWVREEMATLTAIQTYDMPPDAAWKRIKNRLRKPEEIAILQQIAAWRENEARTKNLPRQRILKDETLVEIATQMPQTQDALARLRSIPKGWAHTCQAQGLIAAVHLGKNAPADLNLRPKEYRRPSDDVVNAIEILKLLLKVTAQENAVAAKMISTSEDLEKIALYGHEADVAALHGWRYDVFGKKALAMLEGRLSLSFQKGAICWS